MFGAGDIAAQRIVAAELKDFASKTYGGTFVSPVLGLTPATNDNSAQFATTAWVQSQAYLTTLPNYVTSFNSRTGPVNLGLADVTTALGYTPANKAGDTVGPMVIQANGPNALTITGTSANSTGLLLNNGGADWSIAVAGTGFGGTPPSGSIVYYYNPSGLVAGYVGPDGTAGCAGLFYGRRTGTGTLGMGLGRIFRQSGGTPPSDGAEGDICLIY